MANETKWETVKLLKTTLALVKENKRVTLVPVSAFIERAIMEKLENDKKKADKK